MFDRDRDSVLREPRDDTGVYWYLASSVTLEGLYLGGFPTFTSLLYKAGPVFLSAVNTPARSDPDLL